MSTLYDAVRAPLIYNCEKHNLSSDANFYATETVNGWTNDDLLFAISVALETAAPKPGVAAVNTCPTCGSDEIDDCRPMDHGGPCEDDWHFPNGEG